jgi:hypothetical protein
VVWVLLVCFCFCSNALADETGNILGNTANDWTGNRTYCSSSSCWGGYSGGQTPSFSEDGTIRWGYGGGGLEQNVAINSVLAANTGISVEGYRYSWQIKNYNANTQSGSPQDPLQIKVTFYDNNNQVVETKTYDYSYSIPSWTWFSGTEWFQSSYLADELNSVSLYAEGDDAGYWAGWYGPEFGDYSISLIYSVDACISDPLSSTDCPGYADAYLDMMCTADTLYDPTCPGYAESYALANVVNSPTSNTNDGSTNVDDGSTVNTGGGAIANDGSVDETSIATAGVAETTTTNEVVAEPIVAQTEPTNTGSQQNVTQEVIASTPTQETVGKSTETQTKEVAVVEEKKEDPQQAQLEEANSMELDKMSPREVLGVLSKLGIVGNPQTNGVGNPTGLGGGPDTIGGTIETEGGTISSSPLPNVVQQSIANSSADSQTDGSMAGPNDGSYSNGAPESKVELSASSLPNSGMPDSMSASDFGVQADGSYSMLAEIEGAVYQITFDAPEQSQNPSATGGDPTRDLNSVFGGPELIVDNTKVTEYAEEQNGRHETFARRMIRERIMEINQDIAKMNTSENLAEGDEKYVQEITEESYAETDALSTSDVNQQEFVESMNTTEIVAYEQKEIVEVEFYVQRDIYKTELPANARGLRNGLAQQLLHEKMIEMQYNKENE